MSCILFWDGEDNSRRFYSVIKQPFNYVFQIEVSLNLG